MIRKNIIWVDCAKIFACICVVLGHLYMSMVEAGWVSNTALYYCLPKQAIYCFHIQIFFVCSGYLYQEFRKDTSVKGHFKNCCLKLIALGVPYFVFSIITLVLKNVFSGSVNSKATPILETLFIKPIAPYWFLYVLFFLFLLIPAVNSKKKLFALFVIAFVCKLLVVFSPIKLPYLVSHIGDYAIWFVLGMIITELRFRFNIIEKVLCILACLSGLSLCFVFFRSINTKNWVELLISTLLVLSFIYFFIWITKDGRWGNASKLRKYILPVFLMHTIFAAAFRSILLKVGIHYLAVHIIVGAIVSFALPMLVIVLPLVKYVKKTAENERHKALEKNPHKLEDVCTCKALCSKS